MYNQTGKLWFKIISFIVLEAFLFTIADISWAANYKERKARYNPLTQIKRKYLFVCI